MYQKPLVVKWPFRGSATDITSHITKWSVLCGRREWNTWSHGPCISCSQEQQTRRGARRHTGLSIQKEYHVYSSRSLRASTYSISADTVPKIRSQGHHESWHSWWTSVVQENDTRTRYLSKTGALSWRGVFRLCSRVATIAGCSAHTLHNHTPCHGNRGWASSGAVYVWHAWLLWPTTPFNWPIAS